MSDANTTETTDDAQPAPEGVLTNLSVAADTGDPDTYIVGNHAEGTAYLVDLSVLRDPPSAAEPACTCPAETYRPAEEEFGVCKHVLEAIAAAPRAATVDAMAAVRLREELDILQECNRALVETVSGAGGSADGGSQATDDDGSDDDTQDSDGVVTEATPDDTQETLMQSLSDWFDQAADFNDFDADIIDLNWVEADGVEGIHVDRVPWNGYYDDGWQDRDGFEEEKETVKETVLSPRDEFEWHGDPDYAWFIAADDVSEVVG